MKFAQALCSTLVVVNSFNNIAEVELVFSVYVIYIVNISISMHFCYVVELAYFSFSAKMNVIIELSAQN